MYLNAKTEGKFAGYNRNSKYFYFFIGFGKILNKIKCELSVIL